jgi:hypothetical protein
VRNAFDVEITKIELFIECPLLEKSKESAKNDAGRNDMKRNGIFAKDRTKT